MDEHQRRVLAQIPGDIERYEGGGVSLGGLVERLQQAAVAVGLWNDDTQPLYPLWARIDGENELLTQPWAPPGSFSPLRLEDAFNELRAWVAEVSGEDVTG